jgi:dihydrofolate synthase/folylpolyglutamate synthase
MFGWKPGLDTINAMINALNKPHLGYRKIHIAGSNGKGSVARMLEAIFLHAGYRVGLYTSPHLVSPLERIKINGKQISRKSFEESLREIKPVLEKHKATYFEALTALAFFVFKRADIDIAIIETGLGGRLDATNIIDPECAIITSISLEHCDHLGKTLEAIAQEKAGIIKKHKPCIVGNLPEEALNAIEQKCIEMESDMIVARHVVNASINRENLFGTEVSFQFSGQKIETRLNLPGSYQVENAKTAIAASLVIEKPEVFSRVIPEAFTTINHQACMQIISENPYVILDVAHNPESIKQLFSSLGKFFPYQKLDVVLGILKDKDVENILHILSDNPIRLYCVTPNSARALDGNVLHSAALPYAIESNFFPAISSAVAKAIQNAGKNGVVVITGSHYVVGEYLGSQGRLG